VGVLAGDLGHLGSPLALTHAMVAAMRWRREVSGGASSATLRWAVAVGVADGRSGAAAGRSHHGIGLAAAGDATVGGVKMGMDLLLDGPPSKYMGGLGIFAPRPAIYAPLTDLGFRLESVLLVSGTNLLL
jgi:hypothetical protein